MSAGGDPGRNSPCPCGSGAKFKKCCGSKPAAPRVITPPEAAGNDDFDSWLPDPCDTLDAGLDAFRRGDTAAAVDYWSEVCAINPLLLDRLLMWNLPGLEESAEELDDDEAWRYLNSRWWTSWKDNPRAWSALAVYWCQPDIRRAAVDGEPIPARTAAEVAAEVERILADDGPEGAAWRAAGAILFEAASFVRDVDRLNIDREDMPEDFSDGIEGAAIVQGLLDVLGRDPPSDIEAQRTLVNIEGAAAILRELIAEWRAALPAGTPARAIDPRVMERGLGDITRLLDDGTCKSADEVNALLRRGDIPRRAPRTDLERAQDLVYEAFEAQGRERLDLARRALEVSPDCADAYVLLAEAALDLDESIDLYAKGVAAGERALGPRGFEQHAGHFWGVLETRGYMRARAGLAGGLDRKGAKADAIGHYEEILRLNPGDNQGVRYVLLNGLLATGETKRAEKLVRKFDDDASAAWRYGRTLVEFHAHGDAARTRKRLHEAVESNPRVPDYLMGRKALPDDMPEAIEIGGESEAIDCAVGQIPLWRATPGALEWMARTLA